MVKVAAGMQAGHLPDGLGQAAGWVGGEGEESWAELADVPGGAVATARAGAIGGRSAHPAPRPGRGLEGAYLEEAHLEEANLRDAHLESVHLERADLRGADLRGADLQNAHLKDDMCRDLLRLKHR